MAYAKGSGIDKVLYLSHREYCDLMSALQTAIDKMHDSSQPITAKLYEDLRYRLYNNALGYQQHKFDPSDVSPDTCCKCGKVAEYYIHERGGVNE